MAENQEQLDDETSFAADDGATGRALGRADGAPATQLAIERVLGEGAHLCVLPQPEGRPIYQTVDSRTGEVRGEWTEAAFLRLVRGVRADVFCDADAGLLLGVKD